MLDTWNSWESDVKNHVSFVEEILLPITFNSKDLLIQALMRTAKLGQIQQAKKHLSEDVIKKYSRIGSQDGLDTIGDIVLDYAIIKRCTKPNSSPKEVNDAREKYGKNCNIQQFSKECIQLQNWVIWGSDEWRTNRWRLPHNTTVLAKCFEALIGALYLDQGDEEQNKLKKVEEFLNYIHFFEKINKFYS